MISERIAYHSAAVFSPHLEITGSKGGKERKNVEVRRKEQSEEG